MYRNEARGRALSEARPGRLRVAGLLAGAMLLGVAVVGAQSRSGGLEAELSVPVQEAIQRLQDQWLVWNSAFLQGDRELAGSVLTDLSRTAEEMGFARLPSLSNGILVRAVEAAREGDTERAIWALDMAETLDPGRPETRFARSRIARLEGSLPRAGVELVRGYLGAFGIRLLRRLWISNAVLWLLASLLATSALFVALQLATKGGGLITDLCDLLRAVLPHPVAYTLAVASLAWPFLLPNGWVWLILFWIALIWSYASSSERWVLVGALLVFGLAPAVIAQLASSLDTDLASERRAVAGLEEGRLYGQLFEDIEQLRETLPDNPAVDQLVGDLQVGLGQDDQARPLYSLVVESEPDNGPALNNIGAFHFHRAEYIPAISFFERAAKAEDARLQASYNLSRTYRRLLEFDNVTKNLRAAREIDPEAVSVWVREDATVLSVPGGIARSAEIRSALAERQAGTEANWTRWARSLPVSLGVLLLGIALPRLRPGAAGRWRVQPVSRVQPAGHDTFLSHWARRLIPGLVSAETGDGGRAFLALFVPVAALFIPFVGWLGFRLLWGYDPGAVLPWLACLSVLAAYFAVRLVLK